MKLPMPHCMANGPNRNSASWVTRKKSKLRVWMYSSKLPIASSSKTSGGVDEMSGPSSQ